MTGAGDPWTAVGVTTQVPFVSGDEQPIIDHAHFRLSNNDADPVFFRIVSATLLVGGEERHLDRYFVYDLSTNEALDSKAVAVAGGEERLIRITFARLVFQPGWGQRTAVAVELEAAGRTGVAVSDLEILEELPPPSL